MTKLNLWQSSKYKINDKISDKISNNSFKWNIIGISTIIIAAIIPVVAMITYISSVNLVKSQVSQINTEMLEQLSRFIDGELMEQERLAITIIENDSVQDLMLNQDKHSLFEKQLLIPQAERTLLEVAIQGNVRNIYILNTSKELVITNDAYAKQLDFKNEYYHVFSYADINEDKFVWIEPSEGISSYKSSSEGQGSLSLIKTIKSKIDNQKLGYIIITFHDKFLKKLYSSNDREMLDVFILSNKGNLVSSSSLSVNRYDDFLKRAINTDSSNSNINVDNNVIRLDTDSIQVFFIIMQRTGWKLVLCADYSKDLSNMRRIRDLILQTSGLLVVFFIIVNFNILSVIIKPLYRLAKRFIPGGRKQLETKKYEQRNGILLTPYGISLKQMLVINFTVVIILPVAILVLFEFSLFYKIIENKIIDSYSYYLEQTAIQTDSKFNRIENSLKNFYLNNDILSLMMNSKCQGNEKYSELTKKPAQIIKEEQAINPDIMYINIFDRDFKLIYSTSSSQQYFPKGLVDSALSKQDGETVYYGPYNDIFSRQVISIGKRIRKVLSLETAGFIHAVINVVPLKESITGRMNGAHTCIYSSDGRTIISSDNAVSFDAISNEEIFKANRGIFKSKQLGTTIIFNKLKANKWIITLGVSDKYIRQKIWKALLSNYYILIIYTTFILLIIFLLVKRFYTPINILNQCVEDIKARLSAGVKDEISIGNFSGKKNEIGQIGQILQYMENEIRKQANELYETEKLKKATELYALQVEINPHFLFNTLETIRWKAVDQGKGDNEISGMIYQLSEFLKITLKNKASFITVEEEIKYAKTFSNILKYKYEDDLDVFFDIDSRANQYRTIKMILQPLIENSIVHGFKEKTGKCIIIVSVKITENKIIYQIKDNGAGISKTRLEELKNSRFSNDKSGRTSIGLKNINERICMNYGEEYGIDIESKPGTGTTVIVVIPADKFM
ncbi:MAG TPA: histidine kinase [Clostridiales bacterium]|nr:histidine kinase [Clostridiales bacterium]